MNIAYAASVSGSIYDLSLNKESDVLVEINTIPRQMMVSKDGDYSFNAPLGNYTLYARTSIASTKEDFMITAEGNYTLDLILEESVDYDIEQFIITDNGLNVSVDNPADNTALAKPPIWILLLGLAIILGILIVAVVMLITQHDKLPGKNLHKSLPEEQLDEYALKVLHIIKKERRLTQKDLRKEVPLSEAKISLILSDLEDKGKIKKIKKGRGNILIFVKE